MGAIAVLTTLLAFAIGVLALAANTKRTTNQLFFLFAVCVGISVGCIYGAIKAGELFVQDGSGDPIPWLRTNAIFGSFLPVLLLMGRESIRFPMIGRRELLRRCLPWILLSIVPAAIALTDSFIPPDSTHHNRKRGPGYFATSAVLIGSYLFIVIQTWTQTQTTKGIRRLELQFLVLNIAVGLSLSVLLALAGNWSQIYIYKGIAILVIAAIVITTFFSICYYRIFDLKDAWLALLQRGLNLFIVMAGGAVIIKSIPPSVPGFWVLLFALGILGLAAPWLDKKIRSLLDIGGERRLSKIRRLIIDCARVEPDDKKLIVRFEILLREHYAASLAILATEQGEGFQGEQLVVSKRRVAYDALRELGWATGESLQRRRSTPKTDDLRTLLAEHSLSLVVAVPNSSPTPSMLLALGAKTNDNPYTYPEVEQLQNIAELMDNILTHSRLTSQAALQAKIEHLAMMSRGLAHDLKNLITPVSSFLIHTDGRYEPDSAEAEVHAAARRSVRVMTDYVREALFFSERLQPRLENVDLREVIDAACELTSARANSRGVVVTSRCDVLGPIVADAVLLQRLLVNLVSNAIDASANGQTVAVSAHGGHEGWLELRVVDTGCGIPPENLARIFEPYFTTKQFGDDIRGFGLGLTICQKITNLHGGVISVDSEVGGGTHAKVVIPTISETRRLMPGPACLALP